MCFWTLNKKLLWIWMPYLRLVNYSECRFQVTALHRNEVLNEDLFYQIALRSPEFTLLFSAFFAPFIFPRDVSPAACRYLLPSFAPPFLPSFLASTVLHSGQFFQRRYRFRVRQASYSSN